MKMYVVNQDGTETIELHSVKYKSRWSEKYNKAKNFIWAYPDFFWAELPHFFDAMEARFYLIDRWEKENPYEQIIDIYVNDDKKMGSFYSRQRGIEEYENILKALEDSVKVYRISEINEGERKNGK